MSSEIRRYELKARAEGQARTRRRIAEVTSQLHREVGPARTTVAEIARRAGVQRLTVYANFPTDKDLFRACGALWLTAHPTPDFSRALSAKDPSRRLHGTLVALYGWYRDTEPMTLNVERDRLVLPALDEVIEEARSSRLARLVPSLAAGFVRSPKTRRDVRASIALALEFWTWRRLTREGLSDQQAARVMVSAVGAAAGARAASATPAHDAGGTTDHRSTAPAGRRAPSSSG
jgi:AcrR family transcriptional regulator